MTRREPILRFVTAGAIVATGGRVLRDQAALGLDFATWVAITSISAGDRQS